MAAHDKGSGDAAAYGEEWACPRCTYLNPAARERCEMCSKKRPAVMKPPPSIPKVIIPAVEKPEAEASIPGLKVKVPEVKGSIKGSVSISVKVLTATHEEEANEDWMKIVDECKREDKLFVDEDFPPASSSLFKDARNPPAAAADKIKEWKRPASIITEEGNDKGIDWTVFRTPRPSDICQGYLGNCWFLSGLAILAERQELVERIILTKKLCKEGVYQVRLCKDGKWVTVLMDDNFPCSEYGRLAYSHSRRKQLWVPLIEKAFAKVFGSYEALTSGRCIESLAALTGAPCERLKLQRRDQNEEEVDFQLVWAQLLSCRESGFLMGASCGKEGGGNDEDAYKKMGLVPSHAYSVLDVQECEGSQLVRLRNPWGLFSWKGDWCDRSRKWNRVSPARKDELMPYGHGEGIFWMSLRDFMTYFSSVEICKYKDSLFECRFDGLLPTSPSETFTVYHLDVYDTTEIEFGIFQAGSRGSDKSARHVADLCILVFEKGSKEQAPAVGKFICRSKREVASYVGFSHMLGQGQYSILCVGFNHQGMAETEVPKYTLVLHSSKLVDVKEEESTKCTLVDALIQLAITDGKRMLESGSHQLYAVTEGWRGLLLVAENKSDGESLLLKIDCSNSVGLVSSRGTMITTDSVQPNARQVIVLLSPTTGNLTISYKSSITQRRGGASLGELAPENPDAFHHPEPGPSLGQLHNSRPVN